MDIPYNVYDHESVHKYTIYRAPISELAYGAVQIL